MVEIKQSVFHKLIWDERGLFSVPELLVVAAVMAFVIGALFDILYFGQHRWKQASQDSEARQNARIATDTLIKEVREAQSPSDTDYGIRIADKLELQFYADVSDSAGPERIRYYLQGTNLMRSILSSSSPEAPWTYNGTEQSNLIAKYVRNTVSTPLFRYYDKDGNELTGTPLSAAKIKDIRLIKADILVDVNTGEPPGTMEIESQVNLRNLRE